MDPASCVSKQCDPGCHAVVHTGAIRWHRKTESSKSTDDGVDSQLPQIVADQLLPHVGDLPIE